MNSHHNHFIKPNIIRLLLVLFIFGGVAQLFVLTTSAAGPNLDVAQVDTATPTNTLDPAFTATSVITNTPTISATAIVTSTATPTIVVTPTETPTETPTFTPTFTPTPLPEPLPVTFDCSVNYYSGGGDVILNYGDGTVTFNVSTGQNPSSAQYVYYDFGSIASMTDGTAYQLEIPISSISSWSGYTVKVIVNGSTIFTRRGFSAGTLTVDPFQYNDGDSVGIQFEADRYSAAEITTPVDLSNCPATLTPTPSPTATATPWVVPTYEPPDTPYLACKELDIVYTLDRSGSMSQYNNGQQKIWWAKEAIKDTNVWLNNFGYLDDMRVALVTFDTTSYFLSNSGAVSYNQFSNYASLTTPLGLANDGGLFYANGTNVVQVPEAFVDLGDQIGWFNSQVDLVNAGGWTHMAGWSDDRRAG